MEEYNLGEFGKLKVVKNKNEGMIYGFFVDNGAYIFKGKDQNELQENMVETLIKEQIKCQNKASELEELSLRIKENGLEKTSQYYQTLQNKKVEGGN